MMKIITPDCNYQSNIELYKKKMSHLLPGSRVLIKRSDPAGISEALIGNWELNLVSIPIEPYFTPKDIMDFVEANCCPHAIVNCTNSENIFEFRDGGELSPVSDFAIFYSSGTTGSPKGVVQTREGMKSNAQAVSSLHGFSEKSVHLTALPLYHCNAAAMSLFGNYFSGGTVVFLKKFKPETFFKFIEYYKVQTANLVPTYINDIINAKLIWPSTLKYILSAAAPLSQSTVKDFYELYGPKLIQGYGLSEAVNFSFTMPLLNDEEFKKNMVDQYPAVGIPISGTEFRIVNEEVQVKGPNNMREYWRNSQATNETITNDGWIKTGDKGILRNNYLVLTGRFKEIIIKGGENFSPVMIEDEFRKSGIKGDFSIVSCSDDRLGENIGMVAEAYQDIQMANFKLNPGCVRFGKVKRTLTQKPRRVEMSKGLVSSSQGGSLYEGDLQSAGRLAKKILKLGRPKNQQQEYLFNISNKIVEHAGDLNARPIIKNYFNIIDNRLEDFWSLKISGHSIIKEVNEWNALMCEPPMGMYPMLLARFMRSNFLLDKDILEVGSGVGNFTNLIYNEIKGKYYRTDISSKFLTGKFNLEEKIYNIDDQCELSVDVVVGVNVIHCSANPAKAIDNLYNSIKKDGYLIFAEGSPNPGNMGAWSLDLLFGFIDGWWDVGGFRDRKFWLDILSKLDGQEFGYSVIREGAYDLGGLYWIKK